MVTRICFITCYAWTVFFGAAPQSCDSGSRRPAQNARPTPSATASPLSSPSEQVSAIKALAEGAYGKVEEPFVVIAREEQVYGALRTLVDGLPELGPDAFKESAVVAAFSGTRSSGGFAVKIQKGTSGRVVIEETGPPRDAIVTQALTQPFKVVSIPVGEDQGIELELRAPWKGESMKVFRVASGTFTTGGGIAGRQEKLTLAGSVNLLRHGKLVTLVFDLKGDGGQKARVLKDAASGVERDAESFEVPRLDAGTLVDSPRSPLKAMGKLADSGRKLSLTFESLPARVADGYSGSGELEAR